MEGISQKLLIVERKLISNRGHHHTQIGALKSLFPRATIHILAGDGYDGFLGEAVGKIGAESLKLSRLRAKMKFGSLAERFAARVCVAIDGRFHLPASAYGQKLIDICDLEGFTGKDIVIIPSADIDALESAIELVVGLGDAAPVVALRFLSPSMGEKSLCLLQRRLRDCGQRLTNRLRLYTETEELAAFFKEAYGLDVAGGFFLPCSIEFENLEAGCKERDGPLRIGVFGAPRKEKGSERITQIVLNVANILGEFTGHNIEFVVQGSSEDFSENGIYRGLRGFRNVPNVSVSAVSDRLSPDEFESLFRSVDVVLLPYDVNVYRLQGSGVIQDAVAALKPIIYTRGMSMVGFLEHGNAVAAETDDEFADALINMVRNRCRFYDGALNAARFYQTVIGQLTSRLSD